MAALILLSALAWIVARASLDPEVCPTPSRNSDGCSGPRTPKEYLERLSAIGYDKTYRPICGSAKPSPPTKVEVQMRLTQLNQIDQKLGHMTLNGYFRTWWQDPRLAFNSTADGGCLDKITLNGDEADDIWRPDIYYDNLVEKSSGAFPRLVQVSPDGRVWRSEMVLLKVENSLDLGRLPYDSHIAEILVASYSLDITQLRLTARGGVIGEGASGVGLKSSAALSSAVWSFGGDEEFTGLETPGEVRVVDNWDFLSLEFKLSRKPKYFVDQVILPTVLFLLVSYIQFFVDPKAAPARAALAVIPVLIMRTMGNSVYRTLPEGSQQMWLADFLTTSMMLCIVAALQFGLVQYFLTMELQAQAMFELLKKSREAAELLFQQSRQEGLRLLDLMERYMPEHHEVSNDEWECLRGGRTSTAVNGAKALVDVHVTDFKAFASKAPGEQRRKDGETESSAASAGGEERKDGMVSFASADEPQQAAATGSEQGAAVSVSIPGAKSEKKPMRKASTHALTSAMKEVDMLAIFYTRGVYEKLKGVGHNHAHINVTEMRKALTYFNVYMGNEQTSAVICMFLRDMGEMTPVDEMTVTIPFSRFMFLLLSIDKYFLTRRYSTNYFRRLVGRFQAQPMSMRCDMIARIFFPVCIALLMIIYMAILTLYSAEDTSKF